VILGHYIFSGKTLHISILYMCSCRRGKITICFAVFPGNYRLPQLLRSKNGAVNAVNSKLPLCRGNPNYRYKTKVTPLKRSKKYLSPEYFYSFWGGNYKEKILREKVRKHAFNQGKKKNSRKEERKKNTLSTKKRFKKSKKPQYRPRYRPRIKSKF